MYYRHKLTPQELEELKRLTKEKLGDKPYTVYQFVRVMEKLYIHLHGREESEHRPSRGSQ